MKALRKRLHKVKEIQPWISSLSSSTLSLAFPQPLKFFKGKEFRRYLGNRLWWDGHLWHRGTPLGQEGPSKGISPELRIESDYHVEEDGLIHANTDFFPSEYSLRKQRRKKSIKAPTESQAERFHTFLAE